MRGHSSSAPGAASRSIVPPGGAPPGMGPPVQQQGPVYSRYDQERFRGKEGTLRYSLYPTVSPILKPFYFRNGGIQDRYHGNVPWYDIEVCHGRQPAP